MEISYNELRCKEVINLQNGARMGRIIDMIIDAECRTVLGLVVPGVRKLFKPCEDIFIPWKDIVKIGDDVLLVSLNMNQITTVIKVNDKHKCKENNSECGADCH